MYKFFSHFYTLLDSGVLFWGVAKIALLAMVVHIAIKKFPARLRVWSAIILCFISVFILKESVIRDFARGGIALADYYWVIKEAPDANFYMLQAWNWGERSPKSISWAIRNRCEQKEWKKAAEVASEGLLLFPENPEVLIAAGEMFLFLEKNECVASIGRILILHEKIDFWMKGYDLLARSLVRMNKISAAVQIVNEEISKVPSMEVKKILEAEVESLIKSDPKFRNALDSR